MDQNANLFMKIFAALFWAIVVGLLAKRKNRNPIGWGIAGAVSWFVALIILSFMSYLCPECSNTISNKEAKNGECSHCKGNKQIKPLSPAEKNKSIKEEIAEQKIAKNENKIVIAKEQEIE